jgi:hypothetical protein
MYCSRIHPQGLRKLWETSVWIASVLANIQIEHLLNKSLDYYL